MQKEDLVLEFYNILTRVEQEYLKDRFFKKEYLDMKLDGILKSKMVENPDFVNKSQETFHLPFAYEFYLNGTKCKMESLSIRVLD